MIATLANDFLHACRTLRKSPGFAIATVLLLSIGIGGTTLVFSAVDAVLVRQLPVSHPSGLARILALQHNRPPISEYPFLIFEQWQARSRSFANSFAQSDLDVSLSEGLFAEPIRAEIVTGDYFTVLGVAPELGRLLTKGDEWATQDELPVVLSYDFWRKRFGGDPQVLGRVVHFNGEPFVVVGVTRKGFSGISVDSGPDVRVPFIAGKLLTVDGSRLKDPRRCCLWEVAGRLRPGVTLDDAQAETVTSMQTAWEAATLARRPLTEDDRRWIRNQRLRVERIDRGVSWLRERFSTGLLTLMGAVALLLLLACANVAGLLLARVAAREQETAVRLALGATRSRLVRQWMVESTVLALLGGVGGLLVTGACLPLFQGVVPPIRNLLTEQLPVTLHVQLDMRVFGFALLMCGSAAILAGLSPAWHASRTDLASSLKVGTSDPRRVRLRALLVGIQVAISTIVLANAGLMVETLHRLDRMNPGFDRDHVVTFTVDTALQKYNQEQARLLALRLLQETRNLPGVSSAAIAARGLMRGAGLRTTIGLPGSRVSVADGLNTDLNVVSPGYFETMGMRLLTGHTYDNRDLRGLKPEPVVVNQSFVGRFFPTGNAIGQRVGTGAGNNPVEPDFEIVGVVADAKYRSLREPSFPAMFECMRESGELQNLFFQLEVRTYGKPESVISSVEALLRRMDPRLPFREIHTLRDDVETSLWTEHTMARLGTSFSVLAALLAGIGLYGLLSYTLAQRRREIGIRMALGATASDIMRVTVLRTLAFVLVGVSAGLAVSIATGQLLRGLLYGVSPMDPWAGFSGAALIIATAATATILPAVRVARLDPSTTLRYPT